VEVNPELSLTSACFVFLERKDAIANHGKWGGEIAAGQAPETVSEITKHSGISKYGLMVDVGKPGP
jgi:hypothetical protein